jgi:hypothetical protein
MNKIAITNIETLEFDNNTFKANYETANKMLSILRSDHFREIILANVKEVESKNLKFLIQITRLLKNDVFFYL